MSSHTMKSVRWLAPLALVGVVGLAACGDETASEAAVGSGNRAALAAEAERYVDLQRDRAAVGSGNRAALAAEAERYVDLQRDRAAVGSGNRAALAAEAERYVDLQQDRAGERGVEPSGSDSGPNVFEAGNRAAAEALAQPD